MRPKTYLYYKSDRKIRDDFATNRNTITIAGNQTSSKVGLYTSRDKFQRFNAIHIKARSTKHMNCTKKDGADQKPVDLGRMQLGSIYTGFGLSPDSLQQE